MTFWGYYQYLENEMIFSYFGTAEGWKLVETKPTFARFEKITLMLRPLGRCQS